MKRALSLLLLTSIFASANKYYLPDKPEAAPKATQAPKPHHTLQQEVKASTSSDPLSTPIDINVRDVDLVYLLSVLSNEANVPISLREMPDRPKVSYFSLKKPLRVILDELASTNDLWWEMTESGILMYRHKSAVYKITLPLLQKEIKEDNQAAKLNLTMNRSYWAKVEDSLKGLISDKNSKVSVNEMGYVFVYARPSEIRAIEGAIKRIQEDAGKEIPLEIKVMLIDEDTFREIGVGLNVKSGPFEVRTTPNASPNPFLTLSVLSTVVEARLRALAESGKVSVLENNRIIALNGQPIIYAPQRTIRIVGSYKVAFIPGGPGGQPLPTLDVKTEDIQEGSYLLIVPQYVASNRILFDLYYRLNRIEAVKQLNLSLLPNTPPSAINLPELSTYANLAQTTLERGKSVALFSGSLSREEIAKSGIPFLKDIPVLGYLFGIHGRKFENFRLMIVITFQEEGEQQNGRKEGS